MRVLAFEIGLEAEEEVVNLKQVESLIKDVINGILEENSEYTVLLRDTSNYFSARGFMFLRNESSENYWRQKQLCEDLRRSETEQIYHELRERHSKRLKKKELPNEQDQILPGFSNSTSSMIKQKAHDTFMGDKVDCHNQNFLRAHISGPQDQMSKLLDLEFSAFTTEDLDTRLCLFDVDSPQQVRKYLATSVQGSLGDAVFPTGIKGKIPGLARRSIKIMKNAEYKGLFVVQYANLRASDLVINDHFLFRQDINASSNMYRIAWNVINNNEIPASYVPKITNSPSVKN
ncbi:hypothetical protein BDF21DRAFT_398944 [Thamnidium elegans]|nr:hypothetical protein BDF21DRAFT_398944 [Thamnidium elegans]